MNQKLDDVAGFVGLVPSDAPAPAERPVIASGWHIVLCEPNRELAVVAALTARGYECCCPCDYIRRRTGRRDANGRAVLSTEATPKAMIPGYAFVRMDTGVGSHADVRAVRGVARFHMISTGGEPKYAGLTHKEIADLRLADDLEFEKFQKSVAPKSKDKPAVEFRAGKEVRVFSTKLGREVHGAMNQKRGGGLVELLVGHLSVIVPHGDVMDVEGTG